MGVVRHTWKVEGVHGEKVISLRGMSLPDVLTKLERVFHFAMFFVDDRDLVVDLFVRKPGKKWKVWAHAERELGSLGVPRGPLRWRRAATETVEVCSEDAVG